MSSREAILICYLAVTDFLAVDLELVQTTRMEREIPFGNSNRENGGAYHLTENFGNTGWKVNGKVTFRKFQPKIEEYVLR